MNPEDTKIGQKYNLTLLATDKAEYGKPATFETPSGRKIFIWPNEFEAVSPENGIKNTESASKYDPRRKFRKGDKVRFKEHLGRKSLAHCDGIITLEADEKHGQCFWSEITPCGDIIDRNAYFCYLELVTPAEEIELFYVCENTESKSFEVRRKEDHKVQAAFYYFNGDDARAKSEAAKATLEHCDRLNAEHRKEQK